MKHAAVYARYSTDLQRETSLDDQIKRCHEIAQRHGYQVSNDLIFTDAALSGTSKHTALREGYQKLLAALEDGKIDVLIVDEFSRLSRDAVDQAQLMRFFEENPQIRMITADGHDTTQGNWQLGLAVVGAVAQQSVRDIKHRVKRGMLGVLERGYMCAYPPLGYKIRPELDSNGQRIGTHWEIVPDHAKLVRQIFEWRANGMSMHDIARTLNDQNVPTYFRPRKRQAAYWIPARIRTLLSNPIYKGEYHHNRTAKSKKNNDKTDKIRIFPRPHLRIVTDEIWDKCNQNRISRTGYGGGTHPFSGLFSCGGCGSTLVLTSARHRCRSLYCAQCTNAKSVAGKQNAMTSTIAVDGVKVLLEYLLRSLLTPESIAAFHKILRKRLQGDVDGEIEELKKQSAHLRRVQERLATALALEDDDLLLERYRDTKHEKQLIDKEIAAKENKVLGLDKTAIMAQLDELDPFDTIRTMLNDSSNSPEKIRAILFRLFSNLVFEGKESRYESYFTVEFCVGAAMALTSKTNVVVPSNKRARFKLRYTRIPRKQNASFWEVQQIPFAAEWQKPQPQSSTEEEPVEDCAALSSA